MYLSPELSAVPILDTFVQQLVNGLTLGAVYAVVALGYTMVYGIVQLINFAHGEVVMIGAMVAFSVLAAFAGTTLPPLVVMLVAVMAAIPACMAVGYVMERMAYRPLRQAPRLAPLITAIGIAIILQTIARIIWTPDPLAFRQVIKSETYSIFGNATITNIQIGIIVLSVMMMAALAVLVYRTKLGCAMRATAQNPTVAGLMGVDINRLISMTFVIGAALAAVAGVMIGAYYGRVHYTMGELLGLKAFCAAVLGGIGNIPGAMLGGLLLGLVEALGAGYIGDLTNLCHIQGISTWLTERCANNGSFVLFGSNYQDVFAFVVLILVLLFRPSGLLGERVGDRA